LINAEKAADVIAKKDLKSFILENTLNQNETFSIPVNANGNEPLVATLCWTDPKGILPSNTIDDSTPNLVNNLDIRLSLNGTDYLPWKLDGTNVTNPATRDENNVDNVEKVEIINPVGSYLLTVSHKGNLQNNLQNYSLIISGVTAKDFWTTTTENSKSVCTGTSTLVYNFKLHTKVNFNEIVTFSTNNLPDGIIATFNPMTMNSAGNFTLTLTNLTSLIPGKYTFRVKSQTSTDSFETEITLTILSPNITVSTLIQPENNTNSIELDASFNWADDVNAQLYDIQISSDANFNSIVDQATISQNNFISTELNNNTMNFQIHLVFLLSVNYQETLFQITFQLVAQRLVGRIPHHQILGK
jgi:hypothetical protein